MPLSVQHRHAVLLADRTRDVHTVTTVVTEVLAANPETTPLDIETALRAAAGQAYLVANSTTAGFAEGQGSATGRPRHHDYGDDSTRRKALEGGAEALLTKPFVALSRRDRQPRRRDWSRGPLRVNRVILVVGQLLPVFSRKRTSSAPVSMSQRCQKRAMHRSNGMALLPAKNTVD